MIGNRQGILSYSKAALLFVSALASILVSGCTLFSPVKNEVRVGLIDTLPLELPQAEGRSATLLLLPPAINPVYDTMRMAYTTRPHEIEYFSRHEWGASPANMLLPLLAQTMENTQSFNTVLTPPHFGSYRYALRSEILTLTQDFTSVPATLVFSLRVQLVDGTSNRVIAGETLSLREPMREETPYAGVVAANIAVANALRQVAEFVLEDAR
ncbi:ABC-type transport auxiliary lipoprotein family protein [Microbulbifer hydrolyticus]|uniref:Cholesterol transport system auxiliary component n=1 Tax=Microbulbifer hydrolyticus TaxID=48074 RepID=A0AA89PAA6_9GAMM|nr:ABC-type transport auxiliary lipoprotein family protein [Microbulbifer hydrolyticus]MBB5210500.1 cholesterol transport system auxiliary component [Microbulbifer hydrolyticus]